MDFVEGEAEEAEVGTDDELDNLSGSGEDEPSGDDTAPRAISEDEDEEALEEGLAAELAGA